MLHGQRVTLRARLDADVPVLHAELHDDVETRSRADSRPWGPVTPGSAAAPYAVREPSPDVACFSVVEKASDELAGEALLWSIDLHNRMAHIGLSLRPGFRGRGLSGDVIDVLCEYAFSVRGLHRLQIETLSDNVAMIAAATGAGFVLEGQIRKAAWVLGSFADEVILGLLADEWVTSGAGTT
jgi:RimJ/RimL family protein N-acetyltransferase